MAKVANVYAESLFELANEKNKIDATKESFDKFMSIYDENVKNFLLNPIISDNEKITFIEKICFESEVIFINFLKVLIYKGRENFLNECYQKFNQMMSEYMNEINVEIKSAKELSEEQIRNIIEKIENGTGKKAKLNQTIDQSLLMGFNILIDGKLLDLSLDATFERLRKKLKKIEVKL